jgi:hypothetical protein
LVPGLQDGSCCSSSSSGSSSGSSKRSSMQAEGVPAPKAAAGLHRNCRCCAPNQPMLHSGTAAPGKQCTVLKLQWNICLPPYPLGTRLTQTRASAVLCCPVLCCAGQTECVPSVSSDIVPVTSCAPSTVYDVPVLPVRLRFSILRVASPVCA